MRSARRFSRRCCPRMMARRRQRQSRGRHGLGNIEGRVGAKALIVRQLPQAFEVLREHDPTRSVALGGECAVGVAPFAKLTRRYAGDLAIVWMNSHPDIGTLASEYPRVPRHG